jgi:Domain of unknown function (DUF5069)
MSINYKSPDLTQHPPRSPRLRLGGYVILARALDKGRASLAGKLGEYHFNCPLDKRFLKFSGIEAEELLEQIKQGKGDGEIVEWVASASKTSPKPWEIVQWSVHNEQRTADSLEAKKRLVTQLTTLGPNRTDILTGFDLLDLDDFVSFGGQA